MITKRIVTVMASLFLISTLGWADFKYTQTSQITGGAMKSMMKGLGIFSKSMREATKPMESVTYVKGDYLRRDSADGSYEIIDLHGKRIINVNPQKQSYSVMTFEQMREAVQQMSQRMNEQMKREAHEKNANVTITPKIEVNPTGRSQTFLGQNAQEVMMKVKMEMQATDATHGTQSGSFDTSIDSWVAPSVSGYREIADFYKKMAMEINWTPPIAVGTDSRVSQSMVELYKTGKIPQGLPMMEVISLGAAGQAPAQQQTASQPPPAQSSNSSQEAVTPSEAAAKAIGGMFGGFGRFGHKKKKQQDEEQASDQQQPSAQNTSASNSTASNSLIEITSRVTSYSTDPIDSSLFQIPAGYTQVQADMTRMSQGNPR
jgi:hypothetical protein